MNSDMPRRRADAAEPQDTVALTIRFPATLRKRALEVAENEDRTFSSLVIYALRRYVSEHESHTIANGTQTTMSKRSNGEGSIYKREQRHTRKDGTIVTRVVWCAAVSLNSGQRKVLYGKTRREVADRLLGHMLAAGSNQQQN
jgi:hypothetical protein